MVSVASEKQNDELPLCVDLDGTLVNTDTLVESAVLLAKANPFYIFAMIFWLFAGKAHLKTQIASRTNLDVTVLPYNQPLLDWLHEQREGGRNLVLVTAANRRIADAVNDHVQLFSQVIASNRKLNIGAGTKRDELDRLFGKGGYDYAGNSSDDLKVWAHCRRAVLVNASPALSARAAEQADIEATFPPSHRPMRALVSAMRPHQWSKNLLVFVSILVAHKYTDAQLLISTIVAFVSFCLCSSSVYLINDLLDLEADRRHSEKHKRPFASGQAPLILGILATPLLLVASAALALMAGKLFFTILVLYFSVTLGYSFYFKRLALLDVLILAMLYTLRIIAGAAVAEAMPSVWLISFSMFIFASLAMAKRYAELKSLDDDLGTWAGGRGYHVNDIAIVAQLGTASGYISTLVLALYIDSQEVVALYHNQQLMWLLCPLLMYWIGRIWLVASRGELHHDPIIFATRDRVSYIVFALGLLTIMVSL
jgi:4-hydroxybenzoate polyprenyltransferase/phosphoserine phosphatase